MSVIIALLSRADARTTGGTCGSNVATVDGDGFKASLLVFGTVAGADGRIVVGGRLDIDVAAVDDEFAA